MALSPNTIKAAHGSQRSRKRVGRGNASGKGTMSARGGKGQTARSGGGKRSAIRAWKPNLLKVKKLRGFKSMYTKPELVTLRALNKLAESGITDITLDILKQKGIIGRTNKGVKIVSTGEIKTAISVHDCVASKTALEAIEKAGGKLVF